ncbi:MAG: zinc ribbon domain-containing protein [Nitrospirota bacterium]|nr:zinc ribbon domain-containing protein [Nitrospirota bacterium]
MPLYEYTCTGCQDDFTLLQSINIQPGETACPECGSHQVTRRLSVFAPSVASGSAPTGGCGPVPGGACGPMGGGCSGGMCGL